MKKEVVRHHFDSIDSTNEWIKRQPIRADQILLATADEQTAGRGRHGSWQSPKGVNLLASFGLKWEREPTLLPLIMAVAAAEMLEDLGFEPALKWPNDILIAGKKVGGILVEATPDKAVIGIGLNVNMDRFDQIDQPATSLFEESGQEYDIEEITEMVAEFFEELIETKKPAILSRYGGYLMHEPGAPLSFRLGGKKIEGTFQGIDENGFLKLGLKNGEIQTFNSGVII